MLTKVSHEHLHYALFWRVLSYKQFHSKSIAIADLFAQFDPAKSVTQCEHGLVQSVGPISRIKVC